MNKINYKLNNKNVNKMKNTANVHVVVHASKHVLEVSLTHCCLNQCKVSKPLLRYCEAERHNRIGCVLG